MDRLSDFVGAAKFREEPLELLMLSACETVLGDDRAALGLAGVAIRAGARSAVGSLWRISDLATYELVVRLYRELFDHGVSRAEALRRAQLALLSREDELSDPYYWSAFLLIGNWL